MTKLQHNGTTGAFWLTVPKAIIESKGWQKGDKFIFTDEPNGIKFTRGERRL